MTVVWNENLKTGISKIDEQHQQLFETVNKLGAFQKSKAVFNEVLIELRTYINAHFKTEEEYMTYTVYPDYKHHKACHDKFVADFRDILKKNSTVESIVDLGPELVGFLENWLNNHYKDEDVELAKHINSCHLK